MVFRIFPVWVYELKKEKILPLNLRGFSLWWGIGRLRQSGVAKQHVSAHFEISPWTDDFVFLTSFTTPAKFLTEEGVTRGAMIAPLVTFTCTRKILRVKKIEIGITTKESEIQNGALAHVYAPRAWSATNIKFFWYCYFVYWLWVVAFPPKPVPQQKISKPREEELKK